MKKLLKSRLKITATTIRTLAGDDLDGINAGCKAATNAGDAPAVSAQGCQSLVSQCYNNCG